MFRAVSCDYDCPFVWQCANSVEDPSELAYQEKGYEKCSGFRAGPWYRCAVETEGFMSGVVDKSKSVKVTYDDFGPDDCGSSELYCTERVLQAGFLAYEDDAPWYASTNRNSTTGWALSNPLTHFG